MAISEYHFGINQVESENKSALLLDASNPKHREQAVRLIAQGKPLILPFNGIYGIFGAIDNPEVANHIIRIKNRPADKGLVGTVPPEFLAGYTYIGRDGEIVHVNPLVDLSQVSSLDKFTNKIQPLQTAINEAHALGAILPAADTAPEHLVQMRDGRRTFLSIWSEYEPMRDMFRRYQEEFGGIGFVATSANTAGQGTHYDGREVWDDFKNRGVAAIMTADFSHLPVERRRSTSVIDLSVPNTPPLLHREGNVSRDEINHVLFSADMGHMGMKKEVIHVKPRS